jgi:virginiamycin B lyase
MSLRESTNSRTRRAPPAARATAIGPPSIHLTALLFAALLVLTLALAPRAAAYVYWVGIHAEPGPIESTTTIARANLDGKGVKRDFVALPPGAGEGGLALDDAHLYWANRDSIGRANLDGTEPDQRFIRNVDVSVEGSGVAVDEEHIYWVSRFSDDPVIWHPGTGAIGRANLDGTGVDESFITGVTFPSGPLALDGSHLYWASASTSFVPVFSDRIGRANLDGTGLDESFITGVFGASGVAVDDAHLWWSYSARFTGGIVRANLDGTGRNTVIGGVEDFFPYGVAVDNAHVYWRGGFSSPPGLPIGRANLDGSRANHKFITGTGGGIDGGLAVDELPFTFGKAKRNRKRGTAKLTVNVPGPGELELAKTRKVKRAERRAEAEGSVKLPVKPKSRAEQKLHRKGKTKVNTKVTFAPDEGETGTQAKRLKLIKRR